MMACRIITAVVMLLTLGMPPGISLALDATDIHSRELREWYHKQPELFANAATDPRARVELVMGLWGLVGQNTPIDNRPYVAALMIDLYNSLPPDLEPPPQCPPDIDYECDVYEPGLAPYKEQWRGQIGGLLGVANIRGKAQQRQERWEWALREGKEGVKELEYVKMYLREHVWPEVDAADAPASLDPRNLDLSNPTHYAELKRWMEETEELRQQGVPPWEAIKRFPAPAEAATPEAAATDTAPATSQAPPKPESPKPTQDERFDSDATDAMQAPAEPTEDTTTPRPWWVAGVVLVFVFAVAWYLRRRSQGRGGE